MNLFLWIWDLSRLSTIRISLNSPLATSLRSSELHNGEVILTFEGNFLNPLSLDSFIIRIIKGHVYAFLF